MKDTTLIFFTFARPEFFGPVLESWEKVPGIDQMGKYAVALGRSRKSDACAELALDFGKRIGREIEIWPDSDAAAASPGSHRPEGEAITRAFGDPACDFAIMTEEDNIVSDDILKFYQWGRSLRAERDRMITICPHNALGQGYHPPGDDADADQNMVRLLEHGFSSWGWATWRDRWNDVLKPEWDWDCTTGDQPWNHGFDWQIDRISHRDHWYHLTPDASRTQSIGRYGRHTTPEIFAKTQSKSFKRHRPHAETRYFLNAAEGARPLVHAPELGWYYVDEEQAVRDAHWHPEAGQVVIDVGCAMGNYAMPALLAGAAVVAIDPDANALQRLQETADANGVSHRLTILHMALYDDSGGYDPAMRAALDASKWRDLTPQPGAVFSTLDKVAEDCGLERVDWIKMDVEGAELGVLRGGMQTLKNHRPRLLIEDHSLVYPFVKEMESTRQCLELLRGIGYEAEQWPFDELRTYLVAR